MLQEFAHIGGNCPSGTGFPERSLSSSAENELEEDESEGEEDIEQLIWLLKTL